VEEEESDEGEEESATHQGGGMLPSDFVFCVCFKTKKIKKKLK
jgi:hypothetical protein